jgi:hypothetical protein
MIWNICIYIAKDLYPEIGCLIKGKEGRTHK